jgi:hypothetical protein
MTQSAPNPAHAARILSSSVAIITDAAPLAQARCQTHCSSGFPPMGSSGFPGSREAA